MEMSSSRPQTALGSGALPEEDITSDAVTAVLYTGCFFCATLGFRKLFVEPLVLRHVFCDMKPRRSVMLARKFSLSAMEAVVYGTFFICGVIILRSQEWSWPSARWWEGFHAAIPSSPRNYISPALRCFYILYGARYASFGVSELLMDDARKDFTEMQVHHWVTVALIAVSFIYGWIRVGTVVMVLFDLGDVPLHIAKMSKYSSKAAGPHADTLLFIANRFFELFGVVFFITRLCMFPYIVWSAAFESLKVWSAQAGKPWEHNAQEWFAISLLTVVLGLQVYWFYYIILGAIALIRHGETGDVRSDDEASSGNENSLDNGYKRMET